MMSDKNVHSNIKYTIRVVELAKSFAKNIFVHFITDGRDTPIHDSIKYLKMLRKSIKSVPNCHIISVSGRYFSMDRESYFDRIDLAFDAMFSTKDEINEDDIETYLVAQHKAGIDDQYVRPKHVYCSEYNGVQKQDVIMFTNFREDRMVEMVKKCESLGTKLVTFIQVGKSKTDVLYKQQIIKHTLSEYLSNIGLKQVKISETTKYAHVTYFMNGGREEPFKDEDRIHIKTRKIENLDKKPKMRAKAITTSVIKSMKNGYDAIIVNYSNPDMIGHTGNYIATKKALEYLDICVAKVVEYAKKMGYFVLITADHGNSEEMRTKNGEPHTAHTLNPVMCVEATSSFVMKKYGGLKDIAPTFLDLMGVSPNKYFEGETLIKHLDNQD